MAEYLVPKLLDQLSDLALKQLGERVKLVMGVEEEVGNLKSKLATIERVLHDAVRRSLKERAVGTWLEKLEDIAYEVDDMLDEWNIKILHPKEDLDQRAQVKARRMPPLLEKVHSFISSLSSCRKQVPVCSDIAFQIKGINYMLESTLQDATNQFNFVTSAPSKHSDFNEFKRPMTTSILDASLVYGRDSELSSVLEHLLSESSGSNSSSTKEGEKDGIKVVSIVGVGGSGKTTLAQLIYHVVEVREKFELRKWVYVSDPFDEKRIASALLEIPEKSSYSGLSELKLLFQLVKESFSGKKFLIVLDDVRTEDSSKWEPFRDSLKVGAPGSIILVTTRSDRVAIALGTNHKHNLGLLPDSGCWSIIKGVALSERSESCKKVKKIGREIAKKCKGLPLAAMILGGLLQFKESVQEWQKVLDSEIWQMEGVAMNLLPFFFSYSELSPQLKRCFSYCATFPKDSNINVKRVIRFWMAQGYLELPNQRGDERLEKKGYECFMNLAKRFSFRQLEANENDKKEIVQCKMPDIVHDFAQFLTKNECHSFDGVDCSKLESDDGNLSKQRARHVTWLGKTESISSIGLNLGKLRSFSIFGGKVPQYLFSSLKSVRSLTLDRSGLSELPPEIGSLIHLRYLNLSYNPLKELPEAICNLYFLETLDLSNCFHIHHLPKRFEELVHLRHFLCVEYSLEEMPLGFEKLTSLRTLNTFAARDQPLNGIEMLKHLNQLEELTIIIYGNVDIQKAELGKKENLQSLAIRYEGEGHVGENPSSIIRKMKLPPNLRNLEILGYPRSQLPNLTSLPELWKFKSLVSLRLAEIRNLAHLGPEFFGSHERAFPSLKKLVFENCWNWEKWEDVSEEDYGSVMPCLQKLIINWCPYLEALPHRFLKRISSLQTLVILDCKKLVKPYSDRENWEKISHIPQVTFLPRP